MGIGLPVVTYVVAQDGSVNPQSALNAANIRLVNTLVSKLQSDVIPETDFLYFRNERKREIVDDHIFETDLVRFSKLNSIRKKYKSVTVIIPTHPNLAILRDFLYLPHIFHVLGTLDYPIIVASEWLDMIEFYKNRKSEYWRLRDNASELKSRLQSAIAQMD